LTFLVLPVPFIIRSRKSEQSSGTGDSEDEEIIEVSSHNSSTSTHAQPAAVPPSTSAQHSAAKSTASGNSASSTANARSTPQQQQQQTTAAAAVAAKTLAKATAAKTAVNPMLPPFDNIHMSGVSIASMTIQQQQALAAIAAASASAASKKKKAGQPSSTMKREGDIWNMEESEERKRVKEFWLSLSEENRNALIRLEKEAVLRKMKEQQKHTCTCSVCGRRRTAIEEELEMLYDAYYEELERYTEKQGTQFYSPTFEQPSIFFFFCYILLNNWAVSLPFA